MPVSELRGTESQFQHVIYDFVRCAGCWGRVQGVGNGGL